ncbi:hypothetical protein DB345_04910 [Spartobacteria bacterium LR76]|nr:hypothetical protein DB345_04910 [Spartobacteria bacterium LR76]
MTRPEAGRAEVRKYIVTGAGLEAIKGAGRVKIFRGKHQSFCVTIPPFFLEDGVSKNYSGAACGT